MLSEYIVDHSIDILALTETWLKEEDESIIDSICPPGYKYIGKPRPPSKGNRGGGVGFVMRSALDVKPSTCHAYRTFEYASIKIKGKKPLHVVLLYRPPPSQKNGFTPTEFLAEADDFFSKLCVSVTGDLCILGDFNLHFDLADDPTVKRFKDILTSLDLQQHIEVPTHSRGHVLDLVITRKDATHPVAMTTITDAGLSDHFAISGKITTYPSHLSRKRSKCHRIKKVNPEALASELAVKLKTINSDMNVNEMSKT